MEKILNDVPYFPLYASNFLANRPYKLMSLGERGLLISMMMECWANGSVPSNIEELAKILGFSAKEVRDLFSKYVASFFKEDGDQLTSDELEKHRHNFNVTRKLKSEGGKKGAENKKAKQEAEKIAQGLPKADPQGYAEGDAEGYPQGSLGDVNSNAKTSNAKTSNALVGEGKEIAINNVVVGEFGNDSVMSQSHKEWVDDYESGSMDAHQYRKESKGS